FGVPFAQRQPHPVAGDQNTILQMRRHAFASRRRDSGGASQKRQAQEYRARTHGPSQLRSPIMDAESPLAKVPETMARRASGTISARRSGISALMPAIRMPTLPKLAKPLRA